MFVKDFLFLNVMKLLLHAGTHKTATTEFQATCYANHELLSKSGLYYPINDLLPENFGISSLISRNHLSNIVFFRDWLLEMISRVLFSFLRTLVCKPDNLIVLLPYVVVKTWRVP